MVAVGRSCAHALMQSTKGESKWEGRGGNEGKEAAEGRMGGKLEVLIDEVKIGGRGTD